jgi:filamentous hemagglutinin family protein
MRRFSEPILVLLAVLAFATAAVAQEHTVVFDDTPGFGSPGNAHRIADDDPGGGFDYRIDYCPSCTEAQLPGGSHGKLVGDGLFQSLLRLDVNSGDTATFAASEGGAVINNIFARVTGKGGSEIHGRLRSEVGTADLYLLNPYGVIFGANAELDVGGSFYVSTADVLRFGPGQNFEASLGGAVPTMVIAPPTSFGFLIDTESPATITFDKTDSDQFAVPAGEALTAVAGRIEIVGRGSASDLTTLGSSNGSLIQLAAVPAGTEVPMNIEDLPVDSLASDEASVHLTDNAILEVGGAGGRIVIRGGRFEMARAQGVSESGKLFAFAANTAPANPLDEAPAAIDIEVAGPLSIDAGDISSETTGLGSGVSGDIRLVASSIALDNGTNVLSKIGGVSHAAAGPDVWLTATGAVTIEGGSLLQSSNPHFLGSTSGQAGTIWVDAGSVLVAGSGSEISTSSNGAGNGAIVHVEAATTVALEDGGRIGANRTAGPLASGTPADTGRIEVFGNRLDLSGRSEILASTASKFDAADVQIGTEAAPIETLTVTASTIGSATEGSGAGGDVTVHAGEILLQSDPTIPNSAGQISAVALAGSSGAGGDLSIFADSIGLIDGGQISTTSVTASQPGKLSIEVDGELFATGGDQVISGVFARGPSGDGVQLSIHAGSIRLSNGADISTSAEGDGKAGDMRLEAEAISITGGSNGPSTIAAGNEDGQGGRLVIDTDTLLVNRGGEISTSTRGSGDAGDVIVTAREVTVEGTDDFGFTRSGIFSQTLQNSTGEAGSIVLGPHAGERMTLRVRDRGLISVKSEGFGAAGDIQISHAKLIEIESGGEISASVRNVATGGQPPASLASEILISDSDTLRVSGGIITAETTGSGPGGRIVIRDVGDVVLKNGASVTSRSSAPNGGDAGAIVIAATRSFRAENSEITTTALDAGGGRISIQARDSVYLLDSLVETTVQGSEAGADAGDIFIPLSGEEAAGIDPVVPEFVVINRSIIRANANVADAGDITIAGRNVLISSDSLIQAHSEEGVSGAIQISSPDADIVSQVATLPADFVDPANRLLPPCVARTERTGSFMVQSREALPRSPDAPLPSTLGGAPGVDGNSPASGSTDCSLFQERS